MDDRKMCIYFEDECPRIKCGWRVVTVKVGHKWVHFTDMANGNRGKVPFDKGNQMIDHGFLPQEREQNDWTQIGHS